MGPENYWLQSLEVQGAQPHQEERLPGSRAQHCCTRQWPFGGDGRRETWAITEAGRPWDSGAENWSRRLHRGTALVRERPGGP